jgi:hypothetical protein
MTNSTSSIQDIATVPITSTGLKVGTVTILATAGRANFAVFLSGPGVAKTVRILELSEGVGSIVDVEIPGFNITEQICLNVVEECGSSITDDALRITEGSIPRIIE